MSQKCTSLALKILEDVKNPENFVGFVYQSQNDSCVQQIVAVGDESSCFVFTDSRNFRQISCSTWSVFVFVC